jgi:2-phospho-L-lactate guanylyltransferase (CobY/MobA/RfbA family)
VKPTSYPHKPWEVFLPLKQFAIGKSRLGNVSVDFRISLIKAMASDLIDTLLQVPNIASITVVGVEHSLITNIANPRLNSFPISEPISINADLYLAIGDAERIAIFLPDLPSVKLSEISLALELASNHKTSFITDQSALGTTAFFSSVGCVPTYFGTNSAAAHREASAFELVNPHFIGIRSDCDDLSDLLAINSANLGYNTRFLIEQH